MNMDERKNYFTDDIREAIRKVTPEEMRRELRSLEGTPTWFAILRYTQDRIAVIQDSFLTLDPISDAVKIARYQGAITGMLDLQDAILTLKFESQKTGDSKQPSEIDKNALGGAYGMI